MTKMDWLKIKKNKQYTIELLYEFWIGNKKENYKNVSIEEFTQLIQVYAQDNGNFSQGKIEEYFDGKFNITKLFDKNKQLIKEL